MQPPNRDQRFEKVHNEQGLELLLVHRHNRSIILLQRHIPVQTNLIQVNDSDDHRIVKNEHIKMTIRRYQRYSYY
jgi:hypothetical protein